MVFYAVGRNVYSLEPDGLFVHSNSQICFPIFIVYGEIGKVYFLFVSEGLIIMVFRIKGRVFCVKCMCFSCASLHNCFQRI